jgi:hypothetical protein
MKLRAGKLPKIQISARADQPDEFYGLGRQRPDERRGPLLPALQLLSEVDELEEIPACMSPAICTLHGLVGPAFLEQGIEARIPVDLEDRRTPSGATVI